MPKNSVLNIIFKSIIETVSTVRIFDIVSIYATARSIQNAKVQRMHEETQCIPVFPILLNRFQGT
jgi:sulfur relay (sulfurtransferase) DsrF/TusC family protein